MASAAAVHGAGVLLRKARRTSPASFIRSPIVLCAQGSGCASGPWLLDVCLRHMMRWTVKTVLMDLELLQVERWNEQRDAGTWPGKY